MRIVASALDEIRAHASEGYPNEICGMLVAKRGSRVVTGIKRATNANTDRPRDTYQIDPREHLRIERECDAQDLDIVGYYHSHPDHASYASIRDRESAWPGYHYLIVSVPNGKPGESKVFDRAGWETTEMPEQPLEVVPR
jgi:proteasome lid subunit RPN8/RPN11